MISKNMILTAIAIGAMSASANAQMANSMGAMSGPGMKSTTTTTHKMTMPMKPAATSDAMMDKKSDAMEDKKEMHSNRHHHHMRHHHHRMMHHKM